MAAIRKIYGLSAGMFLSALVHMAFGGGLYYALAVLQPPPIIAELDLSMLPPSAPPPAPPAAIPAPAPEPVPPPPKKEKAPPVQKVEAPMPEPEPIPLPVEENPVEPEPSPSPEVAEQSAESAPETASAAVAAPEAVSEEAAAAVPADHTNRYIPASQAARQPRWVGNLMTSRDYPRLAKKEGKDGLVMLTVYIDETGRVREVRLMQGSYDVLNEVALRKVREGIFTPAYNREGQAVAAKVTLPIRFQLE
jgi:protein TonB